MTPAQLSKNALGPTPGVFGDNLLLANGTDADHDINVGVGICGDSTGVYQMRLNSVMVKQIDAAWAAGSAAGGLFSGSVGNATWYHVFLIRNDLTGAIDAGFDTSVTAANKPAGYTAYCRLGAVLTDGSANILAFTQDGDRFIWKVPIYDIDAATWGETATLVTLSTPLGIKTTPLIAWISGVKSAADFGMFVSSPDITDSSVALPSHSSFTPAAGEQAVPYMIGNSLRTDTSSRIRVRTNTPSVTGRISTSGWIDPRGRDAA